MSTKFNHRLLAAGIVMLALAAGSQAASQDHAAAPKVTFGLVVDGPWSRNDVLQQNFQAAVYELLQGEFDPQFPPSKKIVCDWSVQKIRLAIDQLLNDPEVDILLAMGVYAGTELARREDLPKPTIAPYVIDPLLQGIPYEDGISGKANFSYVFSGTNIAYEIRKFREIVPFKKLKLLMDRRVIQVVPGIIDRFMAEFWESDLEYEAVIVDDSIGDVLKRLAVDTDAVYVPPLLRLNESQFRQLVEGMIRLRLPSFSLWGREDVERGIMASLKPKTGSIRLARRVALNVQRILLGEDASQLPVDFDLQENLTINMATARAIGFYPSFDIMTEAEIIHRQRQETELIWNLTAAVQEALRVNLDLTLARVNVDASEQEIRIAKSQLLPQIDAALTGLLIDNDRAEASLGSQPQRTLTGSLELNQIMFSDAARANLEIQKFLQSSRRDDLETLRLDIINQTAAAYLNVLRAKTIEGIQAENLRLSRSNLNLASVRFKVGYAGPAEEYRWQSVISNDKRAVIDANAQRNLAEISFNRILHKPLELPFTVEEIGINDPSLVTGQWEVQRFMGDQWRFKVFRDFMVGIGLVNAPELRNLDALIAAQERALLASRRAFWSPTLAFQAALDQKIVKGGAGSEPGFADLGLPEDFGLAAANDNDWSLAFSLTLPLFTGDRRSAERLQAESDLEALRLQRLATAERIEQNIRQSLHIAGAALAAIRLSRDAADASGRNLDLVIDSYTRGVVPIIDLLDAQNAALVAEQNAANAVYDFLIDLMAAERAIGSFFFLGSDVEKETWYNNLKAYFTQAGIDVSE